MFQYTAGQQVVVPVEVDQLARLVRRVREVHPDQFSFRLALAALAEYTRYAALELEDFITTTELVDEADPLCGPCGPDCTCFEFEEEL